MGWKSAVVLANLVIVEGPNDGVYVYNSSNQLIGSIAANSNVDPITNSNLLGITSYATDGSHTDVRMVGSVVQWESTNPSSLVVQAAAAEINDTTSASVPPELKIISPSPLGTASSLLYLFLVGESQDASQAPQLFISSNPGGARRGSTQALVETQGTVAIEPTKAAGVSGNPGLVVGAPAAAGDAIVHIADDAANPRSGSANMLQIEDHSAAPIFAVGAAGGAKVFGDKMGAWNGIGSMAAQFVPWYGMQTGGSSGPTIYGGSGAPLPALITGGLTTYSATAHVGDYYFRTDTPAVANQRLYVCTVAGNPGTWVGIL